MRVKTNTGYLRQDEEAHWYFVPLDLIKEFDRLSDEIESASYLSNGSCDELIEQFEEKFGEYRIANPYAVLFGRIDEQPDQDPGPHTTYRGNYD